MDSGDFAPCRLFSGYESPGPSRLYRVVAVPREGGDYMDSVTQMLKFVNYLGYDFASWGSVGGEVWGDNCDVHIIIALSTQQFVVDRYLCFRGSFLRKVGGPEESCFNPLLSLMGLSD